MGRKILVAGASGQIGTELVMELRRQFGNENVVAADIREPNAEVMQSGPYVTLDVTDAAKVREVVQAYQIDTFYQLVAMLSATAEKHPARGWDLNMSSLFNVLELAKEGILKKIFWPSSIAVFGPTTPKENTPQYTVMEPSTVYGISKQAGERWCEYYHKKYGVDVRSIRYPGLISYKSLPGGGTTDYAVDIYFSAKREGRYTCFLNPGTFLPMMFMEDAIRATITLTEAPAEQVKIRSSYNLAGISFDPEEIAESIREHLPDFEITYAPDFRQAIADSWPSSIDDSKAKEDWGWQLEYDLKKLTKVMLDNVEA